MEDAGFLTVTVTGQELVESDLPLPFSLIDIIKKRGIDISRPYFREDLLECDKIIFKQEKPP